MNRKLTLPIACILSSVFTFAITFFLVEKESNPVYEPMEMDAPSKKNELSNLQKLEMDLHDLKVLLITRQANNQDNLDTLTNTVAKIDNRLLYLESLKQNTQNQNVQTNEEVKKNRKQQREKILTERKQTYALYEQELISQRRDSTMSSNVDSTLNEYITQDEIWSTTAQLISTECTTQFCKIVVDFSKEMQAIDRFELENTLVTAIVDLPQGTMRFEPQPDGSERMIAYMARTGFNLPKLENNNER